MPWLGYYELSSSSYDNEGYLRQVVVPVTKENLEKYSLSHRLPVAYQEGDSLENDQYFLKKSLNNSNIKTNFNYDINSNENTRISEIEALKSELLEQKQLLNSLLSDLSESKKSQEKEIAYIHGGHLQLVEGISFIPEKEVKN